MTNSHEDSSFSDPVTVAFLLQRNVPLEWHETVAIVLEVAEVLESSGRGLLPTYQDLELTSDGTVRFLREPSRSGDSVAALVDILRALLPTDSPTQVWAVVSTTGPDAPVYESASDFAASLRSLERGSRRDVIAEVNRRARHTPLPAGQRSSDEGASAPSLPVHMLRIDEIQTHEALDTAVPDSVLESVRRHGLLPPILVRRTDVGYELVSGSRWLAAATAAET